MRDIEISSANWYQHLKSKNHLDKNSDRTIQLRRRGRPRKIKLHQVSKFRKTL